MKPLNAEHAPEISGGSESPQKNPPVDSGTPICPVLPRYPQYPIGPILDDRILTSLDQ